MSENMADLVLEMAEAINNGHMAALEERTDSNTTPTAYEMWVEDEFVPRFLAQATSA
jgi:hypothetical protein